MEWQGEKSLHPAERLQKLIGFQIYRLLRGYRRRDNKQQDHPKDQYHFSNIIFRVSVSRPRSRV